MSGATFKITWDYTPRTMGGKLDNDYSQTEWNRTLMVKINQIRATLFQQERDGLIERDVTSTETKGAELYVDHKLRPVIESMHYFDKNAGTLSGRYNVNFVADNGNRIYVGKNKRGEIEVLNYPTDDILVTKHDVGELATDSKLLDNNGSMKLYKVIDYTYDHMGEEDIVLKDISGNVTHYDPTCGIISLKKVMNEKVYNDLVKEWNSELEKLKIK